MPKRLLKTSSSVFDQVVNVHAGARDHVARAARWLSRIERERGRGRERVREGEGESEGERVEESERVRGRAREGGSERDRGRGGGEREKPPRRDEAADGRP